MAYQTYTTDALVCGSYDRNTADRSYLLLTRDAGMLFADARSVREERSKQRYALQEFSLVRVSLVRGKSGWRVGSVESFKNAYQIMPTREARGSIVRLVRRIRQYVHGDDVPTSVYDDFVVAIEYLRTKPYDASFEQLVMFRMLHTLGYVATTKQIEHLLTSTLNEISMPLSAADERTIERAITVATNVSHL